MPAGGVCVEPVVPVDPVVPVAPVAVPTTMLDAVAVPPVVVAASGTTVTCSPTFSALSVRVVVPCDIRVALLTWYVTALVVLRTVTDDAPTAVTVPATEAPVADVPRCT